jgi:hypothetical protein
VNEAQLPRAGRLGIVVISVALAWSTYEFVEKPIRFGKRKRRSAAILLPMMAAVGVIGISVATGLPNPLLDDAYRAVVKGSEGPPRGSYFNRSGTEILTFVLPGDSLNTIALFGDSHATQYWPRFDQLVTADSSNHPQVMLLGYGGCPPFPEANQIGSGWDGVAFRCPLFHKLALKKVASANVRTVMYAACWECYFNDEQIFLQSDPRQTLIGRSGPGIDSLFAMFDREVGWMVRSGKRVFIVLPNPNSPLNNPLSMLPRRLPWLKPKSFPRFESRAAVDSISGFVRERLLRVAANTGALIIDPLAAICDDTSCSTVTSDGNAIYQDDHHFRADFARYQASFVDTVFRGWASTGGRSTSQ